MAFFTASYHQLVSKAPSGVPRAPSGGWGFPYHILSPTSLISNSSGFPRAPFHRTFSPTSYQQLLWTPTVWLPVLTDLYNSSTSTQSPTQSLEWHDWSSSSGNNRHAVHRSLSSGASVYECTMGFFYLVPFRQRSPPTRFPLITAIGMRHFLPVHHFGMASLAGSKVKIQHIHPSTSFYRVSLPHTHSIYIYKYIHSQTVSLYQNSSVWLDSRSWDRNPTDLNANPRFYHSATRELA